MTKLNTKQILQRLWDDQYLNDRPRGRVEKGQIQIGRAPQRFGWYVHFDSHDLWLGRTEVEATQTIRELQR